MKWWIRRNCGRPDKVNIFSPISLLFLFLSECAQNLKPCYSDLVLWAVFGFKISLILCFSPVFGRQLVNSLTPSINLSGRVSHMRARDFSFGWVGRKNRKTKTEGQDHAGRC